MYLTCLKKRELRRCNESQVGVAQQHIRTRPLRLRNACDIADSVFRDRPELVTLLSQTDSGKLFVSFVGPALILTCMPEPVEIGNNLLYAYPKNTATIPCRIRLSQQRNGGASWAVQAQVLFRIIRERRPRK